MRKLKDNEYNCYVCYLPNCGEDYKEGDIVEIPEWVKLKNSGLKIQIFIINLIIIMNSGIVQKSPGKQDVVFL